MGSSTDKLARNVQPQLEEGETLQAVFPAQGGTSPNVLLLSGYVLAFWLAKYVVVAVTDRRIAVFEASPTATKKPKAPVGSFPRGTRLGPVSGTWGKIELGGTRYYVHRRFHDEVETANAPTVGIPVTA